MASIKVKKKLYIEMQIFIWREHIMYLDDELVGKIFEVEYRFELYRVHFIDVHSTIPIYSFGSTSRDGRR